MSDTARQRLRKIEGQVKGIERMLEQGRGCDEILTQLMAVRSALDSVASHIVADHVQECVKTMPSDEATDSVNRTVRSLLKLS